MTGEAGGSSCPGAAATARLRFPLSRVDPHRPPAAYQPGGAPQRVVLADGRQAWLVSAYDDARAVLSDVRFSSDSTRPDYPNLPLAPRRPVAGHFISMDPPEHTRLHRAVVTAFSPAAVRRLVPATEAEAENLVAALLRRTPPADLVTQFANPLHVAVAGRLFGVPVRDWDFFRTCTRDMGSTETSPARRAMAAGRMQSYLRDLISGRRSGLDTTALVPAVLDRARHEQPGISTDEATGVANLVLAAGVETTPALTALTAATTLTGAGGLPSAFGTTAEWAEAIVRESLRYWSVVQHGVARVATVDVRIGGQVIQAGDAVLVHLPSANRDPAVFVDPDSFDPTRDAGRHLAFGHGLHRCLGAAVAQMEAAVALRVLRERVPTLRLAVEARDLTFVDDLLVLGVRDLTVTW